MRISRASTWNRDPHGTFKKMTAEIDYDEKHGYLTQLEANRFRSAVNKCYAKGIRNKVRGS